MKFIIFTIFIFNVQAVSKIINKPQDNFDLLKLQNIYAGVQISFYQNIQQQSYKQLKNTWNENFTCSPTQLLIEVFYQDLQNSKIIKEYNFQNKLYEKEIQIYDNLTKFQTSQYFHAECSEYQLKIQIFYAQQQQVIYKFTQQKQNHITTIFLQQGEQNYYLFQRTEQELQSINQQETLIVFWNENQQANSLRYKEQIKDNNLIFPETITGPSAYIYCLNFIRNGNLKILIVLKEIQQASKSVIYNDQDNQQEYTPQIFRIYTNLNEYNLNIVIQRAIIDSQNNLVFEHQLQRSFNHDQINYQKVDIMYQFAEQGLLKDSFSVLDYKKQEKNEDEVFFHINKEVDWEKYTIEVVFTEKEKSQTYDIGIYILPIENKKIIILGDADLNEIVEQSYDFDEQLQIQNTQIKPQEDQSQKQEAEKDKKLQQMYQNQTQLFQVDQNIFLKQGNIEVQCVGFFDEQLMIKEIQQITAFDIIEGKQYQNLLLEWNKHKQIEEQKWKASDLLNFFNFNEQENEINRSSYLYFQETRQIFNLKLFQDMDCKILKYTNNTMIISLGEIYQDILKYQLYSQERTFKFELSFNSETKIRCSQEIDKVIILNKDTQVKIYTLSQEKQPIEVIFANKVFDQNQVDIYGPNLGDIEFDYNPICAIDSILYTSDNTVQIIIFSVFEKFYYTWYVKAYYFQDHIKIFHFQYKSGQTDSKYLTLQDNDYQTSTEFYLVANFDINLDQEFPQSLKSQKQQFLYFNNHIPIETSPDIPRQLFVKFLKLEQRLFLFIAKSKRKIQKTWFASIYTLNDKKTKIKSTLYDLSQDEIIYQDKKVKDVSSFDLSNLFSSFVIPQTISCSFGMFRSYYKEGNIIFFNSPLENCTFNRLNMFVKILIPLEIPENYSVSKKTLSIDTDSLVLRTFINIDITKNLI